MHSPTTAHWSSRAAPRTRSIDPGLWDNLVGGMVPAGETLEQALEREAWEEAGLALDRIEVHHGRMFHVRRPVPEGYQSEWIHVYDVTLGGRHDRAAIRTARSVAIERRDLPDAARCDGERRVHTGISTGDIGEPDAPQRMRHAAGPVRVIRARQTQ